MSEKLNVAIVGLGFGAEFIPIYQRYKPARLVAICQRTKSKMDEIGDAYGIEKRYTSVSNYQPYPNAVQSANITCVGILAMNRRSGAEKLSNYRILLSCESIIHRTRYANNKRVMVCCAVFVFLSRRHTHFYTNPGPVIIRNGRFIKLQIN